MSPIIFESFAGSDKATMRLLRARRQQRRRQQRQLGVHLSLALPLAVGKPNLPSIPSYRCRNRKEGRRRRCPRQKRQHVEHRLVLWADGTTVDSHFARFSSAGTLWKETRLEMVIRLVLLRRLVAARGGKDHADKQQQEAGDRHGRRHDVRMGSAPSFFRLTPERVAKNIKSRFGACAGTAPNALVLSRSYS